MKGRNLKSAVSIALFAGMAVLAQKPPVVKHDNHLIHSMDGRELFIEYCSSCHGADGKGVGPMAEWLKIKSPDLTRLTIREGGKFPFMRVQKVILGEQNITSGHGTREMPIWGPIFSEVTRDEDLGRMRVYNLAEYLETIQAK